MNPAGILYSRKKSGLEWILSEIRWCAKPGHIPRETPLSDFVLVLFLYFFF